jgi:hypothetical protein
VAGERFGSATTVDQLAELALKNLASALPGVDFLISLARPQAGRARDFSLHVSSGWRISSQDLARGPIGRILDQVGESGAAIERTIGRRSQSARIWALPVMEADANTSSGSLGVVAWRRPGKSSPGAHERAVIRAFVARLASAAALLHLGPGGSQKTGSFDDAVAMSPSA